MSARQLPLLILAVLLLVQACATRPYPPAMTDLRSNPASYDNKTVAADGYLIKQLIGGYYLFTHRAAAQDEDYGMGIDIVADTERSKRQLDRFADGGCARVIGQFTHFSDRMIVIGFRSKLGKITVRSVERMNCDDL